MAARKETGNEGPHQLMPGLRASVPLDFLTLTQESWSLSLMSLFLLVYEYVIVTSDRGHTKNLAGALTAYHCGIFSS